MAAPVFALLLRYKVYRREGWVRGVLPVALAGLGCGLVHHGALFAFGMRGYSDLPSLAVTLMSEWPALVLGYRVVHHLGASCLPQFVTGRGEGCGTRAFTAAMWALLLALMAPHLARIDDDAAVAYLMPYVIEHTRYC